MTIPVINEQQLFEKLMIKDNPFFKEYYAFYSSWFGGIVTNPALMLLPIDDHMVHRGDGVFEAMKAEGRAVYLMDEHLQRLAISADKIAIKPPFAFDQIKSIILDTLRIANQDQASIRLYLSRGPGNFSANPYDSVGAQLYIAITKLTSPNPEKYSNGIVIGISNIPVKSSWMAQVKTCNYLPNVLMKKESVDRKIDFVIGLDVDKNITESATENILMVDQSGTIVHPPLDSILKGTTMVRVCELARENGCKTAVRSISLNDLRSAKEILITGTSLNVLPVVQFEHRKIGDGKPGVIARKLNALMIDDIKSGVKSTRF